MPIYEYRCPKGHHFERGSGELRHLRRVAVRRPAGLGAFESAPCFEELLEQQSAGIGE